MEIEETVADDGSNIARISVNNFSNLRPEEPVLVVRGTDGTWHNVRGEFEDLGPECAFVHLLDTVSQLADGGDT